MAEWVETYRGIVNAWETDTVEHFTIAYYFDRFADASANFFDLTGMPDISARLPARLHATFQHELRAGAGFHIVSGVTHLDATSLHLGHQVTDSTSDTPVTWVTEVIHLPEPLSAGSRQRLERHLVEWPGPKMPAHRSVKSSGGMLTARDRVKPWELSQADTLSLSAHVHRFSSAALQSLSAIGITSAYMHEEKRGFSTFALDLTTSRGATVGERIDVHTVVAHLSNSSLEIVHRMTDRDGRELATLGQGGVHLDMVARRSTKIPDSLRALATKLLIQDA